MSRSRKIHSPQKSTEKESINLVIRPKLPSNRIRLSSNRVQRVIKNQWVMKKKPKTKRRMNIQKNSYNRMQSAKVRRTNR